MKKIIVIEILVLVILLGAVGFFMLKELPQMPSPSEEVVSTKPSRPGLFQKPTEAPTEPPTEPPTEAPTEPPLVVEVNEDWGNVLRDKEISARNYFVYDCNSGSFLLNSGTLTDKIFPASVTKLFSAYVALKYIDPQQEVIAGGSLNLIDPYSSTAKLIQGDALTAEEMVAGMLICSGNDATYALCSDVGRIIAGDENLSTADAIAKFVEQMNLCAQELGMENSHFVTPDGIHDEEHYVCPKDLITIAKLATEHPVISKYVSMANMDVTTKGGRVLSWENSNKLLHEDEDYYCSYATGLKTGFTTPAGNCLISSFKVGHKDLLIGVFGSEKTDDRYVDTLLLFMKTFGLELPAPVPEETLESEEFADTETIPEELEEVIDEGTDEFAA